MNRMFQKITDNLFYLFIFLLPWQTVFILREPMIDGEKWQCGTIGIYLTDIVLVAWLLIVFLYKTKNFHAYRQAEKLKSLENRKFDKNLYSRLLLPACCLLLAWSFLSIFWSADSMLAFYFSLKLLLAAGLFLALQKIKIDWRKVIFVFLAAAVLQGVLGMGQFLTQESFSGKWLGMNNYAAWQGGVSVLENEEGRWLRAYGSLPHPNILGGYLAVAFLLGMGCYLTTAYKTSEREQDLRRRLFNFFKSLFNSPFSKGRKFNFPLCLPARLDLAKRAGEAGKRGVRGDLKPDSNFTKLLILSGLLIIFLGILLAFSRGAWLALAVGIVFLGANIWLRTVRSESELSAGKNFARKNFVKLLLIFSLAGIIFISVNHENFFTRFDAGKRLEQKSISERSLYFNQAKEIVKENFWLGAGAGNYTLAVFQKDEIKKPIWQYQPVHNVFMLIWAELGTVGLALFTLILTQIFLKSFRNKSLFCCVLCVVCCVLFIDHWLWTTHFGIILFWLVAGLATVKRKS